jgi:hypothetical protein
VSTSCKNQLTGCVIVFEIFRRNGDCTFYVAVKIGGDSKKKMGVVAISFDKAFRYLFISMDIKVRFSDA